MADAQIVGVELPPSAFLVALEAYAADWHESRLPPTMRARGIFGLRFERLGPSGFRLRPRGYEFRFGADWGAVCTGDVRPAPQGGGAEVAFRVGLRPGARQVSLVVPAGVAAVGLAAGLGTAPLLIGAWLALWAVGIGALQQRRTAAVLGPEFADVLRRAGAGAGAAVSAPAT